MFAGNIDAAQGFGTILDAAEKLSDLAGLHWVVLGDGRMRSWIETEVQARELMGGNGALYASIHFNQNELMQELESILSSAVREEKS